MFPLLNNKVIINRFQLSDATLQIVQQDGRWNYAIFKKTDTPASDTAASSSFNTLIRELVLENTEIRYRDGNTLSFSLSVLSAKLDGHLKDNILESKVRSLIAKSVNIKNGGLHAFSHLATGVGREIRV